MRWTGSGKIHREGKTFLYSEHEQYMYGVGMVLKKEASRELIGWKSCSASVSAL